MPIFMLSFKQMKDTDTSAGREQRKGFLLSFFMSRKSTNLQVQPVIQSVPSIILIELIKKGGETVVL